MIKNVHNVLDKHTRMLSASTRMNPSSSCFAAGTILWSFRQKLLSGTLYCHRPHLTHSHHKLSLENWRARWQTHHINLYLSDSSFTFHLGLMSSRLWEAVYVTSSVMDGKCRYPKYTFGSLKYYDMYLTTTKWTHFSQGPWPFVFPYSPDIQRAKQDLLCSLVWAQTDGTH